MLKKFALLLILSQPLMAHAFFGMLGRDQCNYPTSSFPTAPSDFNQAAQVQLQELERNRVTLEAQIGTFNAETTRLQGYIRAQFSSRWAEGILGHMDNGLDCCAPVGSVYVSKEKIGSRNVASEVITPVAEGATNSTAIIPTPANGNGNAAVIVPAPVTPPPNIGNIVVDASCFGQPREFCSREWGQGSTPPPSVGAPLCLQNGFLATPAWYYKACRNGGDIDPQVCSDNRIASNPADAQNCVQVLAAYRSLAQQKKQSASLLAQINIQIQGVKYPNRPSTFGGGSSETTHNLMFNIGGVLGSLAQMAMPLVMNQYQSFLGEKDPRYRQNVQSPLYRDVTNLNRPVGSVYYGPNYGYGFNYMGNYGGQPPSYQTGGFGCSTGLFGAGMNLISQLFGGGALGGSLSGGLGGFGNLLGSFFGGMNGGGILNGVAQLLYGNQVSNIPSYRFGGFSPPYQVNGIYGINSGGGRPAGSFTPNSNGSISNFLTGVGGGSSYTPNNRFQQMQMMNGTPGGSFNFNGSGNNFGLLGGNSSSSQSYLMGLNGGYQGNPYFGNFGNVLSTLFGGGMNVNVNAGLRLTY